MWIERNEKLFNEFRKEQETLYTNLKNKKEKLCDSQKCPEVYECIEEPSIKCVEYKVKKVCVQEGNYCTYTDEPCDQIKKICSKFDKDGECTDYMEVCKIFDQECLG